MSDQINAPPGWYPDPSGFRQVRYWNGSTWSGPSRPASPSAADSWSLESSPHLVDPKPWWQTWFAIVPGLMFCLPVGLVGLWLRKGTRTLVKSGVTVGTVLLLGIAFLAPADSVPTTSAIPATTPSPAPATSTTPTTTTPSDTPSPSASLARVPAVRGISLIKAKRKLRAAGLEVGDIDRRPSSKKKDTVLKQGVGEDEEIERGSSVALIIAGPYPKVPSVVSKQEASAIRKLKNAGFQVKKTIQTRSTGEDEVVLSQSPRGETRAKPNSVIRIVISNVQRSSDDGGSRNCTPGYSPCLPPASDYDCRGGSGDGPKYSGPVRVSGSDPYDLDRDGDGKACEWS